MASRAFVGSPMSSVYRHDQRPPVLRGRTVRARPVLVPARRLGSIRARRLSKPSAVTNPAVTSSQRAVSTSDLRRLLARTMSYG